MISNSQILNQLVGATGSATAYFHRLLNDIIDTLNGVAGQGGVVDGEPDGSGLVAIAHSYSVNGHPASLSRCSALPTGTTVFHVQMVSVSSTALNVKLFDMAGAAITTGTWPMAWRVAG